MWGWKKVTWYIPDVEVPVKPKGRSKKTQDVSHTAVNMKSKGMIRKTGVHDEKASVKLKDRRRMTEEIIDNEVPMKPKGVTKRAGSPCETKGKKQEK